MSAAKTPSVSNTGTRLIFTKSDGGTALRIQGNANVAIYDLEITATGGTNADGIQLSANASESPTLGLVRVTIDSNGKNGINMGSGTLSITQASILDNQGSGIRMTGGVLVVTQSSISKNTGVGITTMTSNGTPSININRSSIFGNKAGIEMMGAAMLNISNNFIYRNGSSTNASVGGLSLSPMPGSKLEFNTIVDNIAQSGSSAAGVICSFDFGTLGSVDNHPTHNIIFRNTGPSSNPQISSSCMLPNSFINTSADSSNILKFLHPDTSPPYDYHLTADSPFAMISVMTTPCIDVDFDGDARSSGGPCDLGADERKP